MNRNYDAEMYTITSSLLKELKFLTTQDSRPSTHNEPKYLPKKLCAAITIKFSNPNKQGGQCRHTGILGWG